MKKGVKKFREINLKKPLYVLSEDYPLLHEFSQIIDKFDEKRDLPYFSGFYEEIMPAANSIVIYIVNNKLAGINKAIDEFVFNSQKIVNLLKCLHSRFKLISDYPIGKNHPDWYAYSQEESEEILRDIRHVLNEMLTLKSLSY